MTASIKERIYLSFSLLVALFVINGIITIITLNKSDRLSTHLSKVVDPTLESLVDFRKMMQQSDLYTTNSVFFNVREEDKMLLKKLHTQDYPALKSRINIYSSKWQMNGWVDSLNKVFTGFEELLVIEKSIMENLNDAKETERRVEEEVIPRGDKLSASLKTIHSHWLSVRTEENEIVERSSKNLKLLIIFLAAAIILLGIFLSLYMARVIINPIHRIRHIVNDLGKGIIKKVNHKVTGDEIGEMVRSVNNLSEKLQGTAMFAHEIGNRNFDTIFRPLGDEDTLGKALISMRDNLKTSEGELLDANAEIQTIYNASLDAVIIIDEEGKIVKWDHKAEILFGWKEDEVMGTLLTETIIPHRNREAHIRGIKYFFKTGEAPILGKTIEINALKKNKKEFDISLSISPSLIKDKYRFIGFIRDITSRKKAEAELHKSEERYRQIVETADEGIWMVDENNRTSFVNKRLCEILGYTSMEMMGKEMFYFMDEEGKKIAAASMEIKKQGSDENPDFKFTTKDGAVIWTYLSTSPVMDKDGKYIGAITMLTDITKRKHDEELLQKSRASLAINNQVLEQKNRELEQFAFVASHDLQEPLRTISGFVELLRKQYQGKLDEKADKCLAYIEQSSDRMKIFIRDLLQYSRIGSEKTNEPVNCTVILREVLADLGKAINETHADIEADPLPVISGHPAEIKQLFQNLIVNAIKFRKKETIPKIKISALRKDDYWEFTFADNGIGIDEQYYEKIFVIFQRLHTRSEYQGSGIGLSNSKKIVELHNGKIWVDSKPGEGSTFQFTICQNNN